MTYRNFRKKNNITEHMLRALGIVQYDTRYLLISLNPDYEITPDQKQYGAYFFRHTWDFADKYEYVIDINIEDSKIYPEEVLDDISEEVGIKKFHEDGDYSKFLKQVRLHDHEELMAHGFPTNFVQFELQSLRISYIDNLTKKANYEGSFLGDAGEVEMNFFPFYSYVTVRAVPLLIDQFYKNLIAEAYLLLLQHNYKLSYFILYSGLENFVRQASPKLKGQVDQILEKLFIAKFGDLAQHDIFSEMKVKFKGTDRYRNDIAHGNRHIDVDLSTVEDFLNCCLVLICSYEFDRHSFKQLSQFIRSLGFE